MSVRTDTHGQLLGLRCHDGNMVAVELSKESVELRIVRLDGTSVRVVLEGSRYFAMDRFLDGNIVNGVFLWPVSSAPTSQRKCATSAFAMSESMLDAPNEPGATQLFVLESSYGATVYALVRDVRLLESTS